MEVILYYMRLEDKYWALFLAGLFLLTVCSLTYDSEKYRTLSGKGKHEPLSDDRETGTRGTDWKKGIKHADGEHGTRRNVMVFTVWYGVAAYFLFLCPLTYHIITSLVPALSGYYEVAHIWLMPVIISFAFATAARLLCSREAADKENPEEQTDAASGNPGEQTETVSADFGQKADSRTENPKNPAATGTEKSRRKTLCLLTAGFVIILFFAGHLVYLFPDGSTFLTAGSSVQTKETLKEEKQVYEQLLADADKCGKTAVRIWGPDAIMNKSRLYNAAFQPVYGKDISNKPENYDEQTLQLYQAYQSYDSDRTQVVNVKEQLDAIANFPKLYPETGCDYVIVYDPAEQFDDFAENWEGTDYDPVLNFEQIGYTLVGRTSSYLLFRAD